MKKVFDHIVLLLSGVALALAGLALVDFLLHPLTKDFTYNSALYRAVSILVLTPLTLLVGFLIIRRVPGNTVILTSIKISFLDIYRLKRSWNSCWYRCQALPNH